MAASSYQIYHPMLMRSISGSGLNHLGSFVMLKYSETIQHKKVVGVGLRDTLLRALPKKCIAAREGKMFFGRPLRVRKADQRPPANGTSSALLTDAQAKDGVKKQVRRQILYYLSEQNLRTDKFLTEKKQADGTWSLKLLAGFPKLTKMCSNFDLIVETVRETPELWLSEDGENVRMANKTSSSANSHATPTKDSTSQSATRFSPKATPSPARTPPACLQTPRPGAVSGNLPQFNTPPTSREPTSSQLQSPLSDEMAISPIRDMTPTQEAYPSYVSEPAPCGNGAVPSHPAPVHHRSHNVPPQLNQPAISPPLPPPDVQPTFRSHDERDRIEEADRDREYGRNGANNSGYQGGTDRPVHQPDSLDGQYREGDQYGYNHQSDRFRRNDCDSGRYSGERDRSSRYNSNNDRDSGRYSGERDRSSRYDNNDRYDNDRYDRRYGERDRRGSRYGESDRYEDRDRRSRSENKDYHNSRYDENDYHGGSGRGSSSGRYDEGRVDGRSQRHSQSQGGHSDRYDSRYDWDSTYDSSRSGNAHGHSSAGYY
eukprot:Rmarinus@m.29672